MSWIDILKRGRSAILDKLDKKTRKKVDVLLEEAEPRDSLGRDFLRINEVIETLGGDKMVEKDDKPMVKKLGTLQKRTLEIIKLSAKLRKEYDLAYAGLREILYPEEKA